MYVSGIWIRHDFCVVFCARGGSTCGSETSNLTKLDGPKKSTQRFGG
jgi:hypothetical protein